MLPDTDEAIAKAVLHEAVKIALGPGGKRTKVAAPKVMLDFMKAKPATRNVGPSGLKVPRGGYGWCWEAELRAKAQASRR